MLLLITIRERERERENFICHKTIQTQ